MVFHVGVPDTRPEARISRRLHAGIVARRIVGARADFQQERRASHDDAKDQGRSKVLNHADVFELGYSESLAQAASHCLALFWGNHEVLRWEWRFVMSMLIEGGIERGRA